MTQRIAVYIRLKGAELDRGHRLWQNVEERVGLAVVAYIDDDGITGRGKERSPDEINGRPRCDGPDRSAKCW